MTLAQLSPEAAAMVARLDANHRALERTRRILDRRFPEPPSWPPPFRDAGTAIAWLNDPARDRMRAARLAAFKRIAPRLLERELRRAGL